MASLFKNKGAIIEGLKDQNTRKAMAELDFRVFSVAYFSHYAKNKFADFHVDMMKQVQQLADGSPDHAILVDELLWVMFRGSAKTAFAKQALLWLSIYKKKQYLLVDSYSLQNSENILFDVAIELQTNRLLMNDYGKLYDENVEHKTKKRMGEFIMANGVKFEAATTQKPLRGRAQGSTRPDFILFDDIENLVTASSPAITNKTRDHISEAVTGMDVGGQVLYLGNYVSDTGIIHDLIARVDNKMIVPAIIDNQPAWPDRYTMDTDVDGKINLARQKEKVGPLVFDREFMNIPHSEADRIFKKEWFQYIPLNEVNAENVYITIDPAVNTSKQSDFTGITINHVTADGMWNIEVLELKIGPLELIDNIFALYEKYNPVAIGIETMMYTQAIRPFLDIEMRKRKRFLPIKELKHGGKKKEARIQGLEPLYNSRSVKHIEGLCQPLEDQLLRFPHLMHDDVLDALAYQLDLVSIGGNSYEEYDQDYETWTDTIGI